MDPQNVDEVPAVDHDGQAEFEAEVSRGRTVMKRLIKQRSKGIRLELEWNENGNPIGPNASTFNLFIGTSVRERVPITFSDWRQAKKDHAKVVLGAVKVNSIYLIFRLCSCIKLQSTSNMCFFVTVLFHY